MKTISLFLLTSLSVCSVFSQDWAPFPPGDTLIYDRAFTPELDLSVWVEEVIETADGEEWKLNPHHRLCDTCEGPQYYGVPMLEIDQPFPFGRSVKLDTLGHVKFFRGDGTEVLLIPNTIVGGSWVMDSLDIITGTVESEYSDSIFGEADVFKKIFISTGDSMLISQQHGLIYFPDSITHGEQLTLIGIPDRSLGWRPMSFWEVYDFQNGANLYYEMSSAGQGGGHFTEIKVTILGRKVEADSISFSVSIKGRRESSGGATNPWYSSQTGVEIKDHTWVFFKDSLHPLTALPGELVPNSKATLEPLILSFLWTRPDEVDSIMIAPVLMTDSSAIIKDYFLTSNVYYSVFDSLPPYLLPRTHTNYDFQSRYERGLGQTYYQYSGPEDRARIELVGYIRNQDTVGKIFTEEYLHVNVEDELLAAGISVFPNPSHGPVSIHVSQAALLPSELTIFTLTGKEIYSSHLTNQESIIDAADLPKGIYLLQLEVPDGRTFPSRLVIR